METTALTIIDLLASYRNNTTVFHKKGPLYVFSLFTQITSNLHEIFTSCSRKNTNSKYLNKIWQLIKYSLLVVM